jgi:DNA-binding LacI/PurR family transcriptional regulator
VSKPAGERKRATIVDVARLANVSAATVSNAINNRRYVDAQTKLRIDAAAAQLGYTPNVHARRMRSTGIGTIGLFSSMPFAVSGNVSRFGFLLEIAATAAISALEGGYALLLVPSVANDVPRFEELAIDGAIVVEPDADDPYIEQLRRRAIPFVTVGKQHGAAAGSAAIDLRSAETTQLLIDHLRRMSARRIALITGTTRRNSYVESEDVYAMLARSHGTESIIVRIDEIGGEEAAYAATLRLIDEHPDLDGILASVDTFATGSLRALRSRGIAVPEQVRLATRYDGIRARESRPPLTAVNLHLDVIAAEAVSLLLEQLRSGVSGGLLVRAPDPELVLRRSTDAGGIAVRSEAP